MNLIRNKTFEYKNVIMDFDEDGNLTFKHKNCEGIELYSPLIGECKLDSINGSGFYPIKVEDADGEYQCFTKNGFYITGRGKINPECLLFPSKEERNWDNFVKRGEFYFSLMLTATGAFALEKQDTDKATDRQSYSSGNYFTTKEEAEKYANMINDILKNKKL